MFFHAYVESLLNRKLLATSGGAFRYIAPAVIGNAIAALLIIYIIFPIINIHVSERPFFIIYLVGTTSGKIFVDRLGVSSVIQSNIYHMIWGLFCLIVLVTLITYTEFEGSKGQERTTAGLGVGIITLSFCIFAVMDLATNAIRKGVMSLKQFPMLTKLLTAFALLIFCFLGFYLLDGIKAIIWLCFLIVSYPVLLAFMGSLLNGVEFSPRQLQSLYKDSLRSVPVLGKFIRDQ